MKPEDIKDKKIAVLCDTYEKAKRFFKMCIGKSKIHVIQEIQDTLISLNFIEGSKCLRLESGELKFDSKEWCELHGYKIITFEEFIGETTEEAPLTAEEVVGVLLGDGKAEIFAERFTELFGGGHCISEIGGIFTPSEIVQKITEWKRKQSNVVQVTDDMVTDVLNEKYGAGKWNRKESKS